MYRNSCKTWRMVAWTHLSMRTRGISMKSLFNSSYLLHNLGEYTAQLTRTVWAQMRISQSLRVLVCCRQLYRNDSFSTKKNSLFKASKRDSKCTSVVVEL